MKEINGELYFNEAEMEKVIEYALEEAKEERDKVYRELINSLCNEPKGCH
jgi:hypothetical protein